MKKNRAYFIDFIIVTAGVLMALFLSNLKESSQERKYYKTSIETINMEVQENQSNLERVVEKQTKFLHALLKHANSSETILDLLREAEGLQVATVSNSGLDFYKKNKIHLIDFHIMKTLINMESASKLINAKAERLVDCTYANITDNSKESKKMVVLHLQNLLNTEKGLLQNYEDYIEEHIGSKSIK